MKQYHFRSQSRAGKVYVTILYDNGSLSCDCPGWTKRKERICVHTRVVRAGNPEGDPLYVAPYATRTPKPAPKRISTPAPARAFSFDE